MKIKIQAQQNLLNKILTRIALGLSGIFATSLIFAISIKLLNETGIWIGLAISGALIFCGFKYTKQKTQLRFIAWSTLITLSLIIAFYFFLLSYISKTIEVVI